MAKGLDTTITTPKFRVSYPSIFHPQLNKLSGKEEYSVQALFPAGEKLTELRKMAENACINKWGPDKTKWPKNIRSPFKDQKELIEAAERKERDHSHLAPGAVFMTFKTPALDKKGKPKAPPVVVGKNPKEVVEDESRLYGGCWARANVNAAAYERGGNHGVAFYLNAVQIVGDGEPFGGKPNPESAFEAIPEDDQDAGDASDMFS